MVMRRMKQGNYSIRSVDLWVARDEEAGVDLWLGEPKPNAEVERLLLELDEARHGILPCEFCEEPNIGHIYKKERRPGKYGQGSHDMAVVCRSHYDERMATGLWKEPTF